MAPHRSRLCHLVVDCDDLDTAVAFWSAALGATEEPVNPASRHIYRRLRLPDAEIRLLLQRTDDEKSSKERIHLDIETDDVEAEVQRLEKLGATRWDHQRERGFDFWVLRDPFGNEFCVLQTVFPELLKARPPLAADRQRLTSTSRTSRKAITRPVQLDRPDARHALLPGSRRGSPDDALPHNRSATASRSPAARQVPNGTCASPLDPPSVA